MKALFHTAAELETFLVQQGWRYCFIGGIALQRWGQPRLTNDIDLTILTGFGNEASYVDELLGRCHARIPDGRDFALKHRTLLPESREGIPIDVALGGIDFEELVVSRANRSRAGMPGVHSRINCLLCSAMLKGTSHENGNANLVGQPAGFVFGGGGRLREEGDRRAGA